MAKQIPFILIIIRLILAPVMIFIAYQNHLYVGQFLALAFVTGILTDVFDGIVARKLGISTNSLRKWDSNVDLIFILSALYCAFLFAPAVLMQKKFHITLIVFLELTMYGLCYFKFKKFPANHAYSSKGFAVLICISLSLLFLKINWDKCFYLTFLVGMVAYLDNFLILLLLKEYKVDTKVFWKANN